MTSESTPGGALDALAQHFKLVRPTGAGRPVFVLAGGWRSGSTLMQRLVASSGEVLMWGEPYDLCALVEHLAESTLPITLAWPLEATIVDPSSPPSPDDWIANTYPHPSHLVAAHRAFFDRLFGLPALEAGSDRWGVKSVRLGGSHAGYLHRLYPDAAFVVVHRNPYDAFRSFRDHHAARDGSGWFWRWPDRRVTTANEFGEMWAELTGSLIAAASDLAAVVAAYEEFAQGDGLDVVETLIDAKIDRRVLDIRVGGATGHTPLDSAEEAEIRESVGPLAANLGYLGPTSR